MIADPAEILAFAASPIEPEQPLPRAKFIAFENLTEEEIANMNQAVQEGVQGVKALPGGRVFLVIDLPPGPGSVGSLASDLGPRQTLELVPCFRLLQGAARAADVAGEQVRIRVNGIKDYTSRNIQHVIKYGLQSLPERLVPLEFFIMSQPNAPVDEQPQQSHDNPLPYPDPRIHLLIPARTNLVSPPPPYNGNAAHGPENDADREMQREYEEFNEELMEWFNRMPRLVEENQCASHGARALLQCVML